VTSLQLFFFSSDDIAILLSDGLLPTRQSKVEDYPIG
jgi:hypothetical protein